MGYSAGRERPELHPSKVWGPVLGLGAARSWAFNGAVVGRAPTLPLLASCLRSVEAAVRPSWCVKRPSGPEIRGLSSSLT